MQSLDSLCAVAGNGGCEAQWMLDLPAQIIAQEDVEDRGRGVSLGEGSNQRGPILRVETHHSHGLYTVGTQSVSNRWMNRGRGTVKGMRGNWLPGNQLDEWTDREDTGEWGHKETQVTVDRWLPPPKCLFCPPKFMC